VTRETPLAKAARYLAERRVTLEAVEDDRVRASVRGETGTYRTTGTARAGGTAIARPRRRCSHEYAVELVVGGGDEP